MQYLHTMVRVRDLDRALHFYRDLIGLEETRRKESPEGRYTLVFLKSPGQGPRLELTWNWDPRDYAPGDAVGHLAYGTENIYEACETMQASGIQILRPPRDGRMAFVRSPDGVPIELLQLGDPLPPQEPWASMENQGTW